MRSLFQSETVYMQRRMLLKLNCHTFATVSTRSHYLDIPATGDLLILGQSLQSPYLYSGG